jgi:hypothetical protein
MIVMASLLVSGLHIHYRPIRLVTLWILVLLTNLIPYLPVPTRLHRISRFTDEVELLSINSPIPLFYLTGQLPVLR